MLHLQLQRAKFLSDALNFTIDLETHLERDYAPVSNGGPETPVRNRRVFPEHIREQARQLRDVLVVSRDFELAQRLMDAVRMRDEEARATASATASAQPASASAQPASSSGELRRAR